MDLRPIVATDIPVWYGYLTDPAVYEHTSWNVQSPEDLADYVETLIRRYQLRRNGHRTFSEFVNSLSDEELTEFAEPVRR